ncbi:MAG: site-specific DNA-methyltransferase [Rikenellaceae bacterium]
MEQITKQHPNSGSADLVRDNIEQLAQFFPEVIKEGKVDFEALHDLLGEYGDSAEERFCLNWAGKARARREAQKRSTGTLRPCKEDSVDWDTTENLYIEGDNLEVLKLLQKSYHKQVKMIYIDPPYNTGKDFVYKDNYKDNMANYLELTGQDRKMSTKALSDSDGRYHSNWLNMMYPRLKLARNLLTDDGVIFISIDDNEVDNLKKICNEIFGEENFVADIIWNSTKSVTNTALISVSHTHTIVFFKEKNYFVKNRDEFRLIDNGDGFTNPDNDPRGDWKADPFQVGGWRPNQQYEITNPKTGEVYLPNSGCSWKNDYDKYIELVKDNRIVFGSTGEGGPQRKRFIWEAQERGKVSKTLWDDVETTTNGTQLVKKLFDGVSVFDNPKPVGLLLRILELGTKSDSIILDFFSGSATTAHAVIQQNAGDKGNRKYICVQIPEITPEES